MGPPALLPLALLPLALLLAPARAALHWPLAAQLHPDLWLLWAPSADDVMFELRARTLGYVALGFSADGSMADADMVVGWVRGDLVFLQDRHAQGHEEPQLDASSDYELLAGYENGSHTVLRFRRRLRTCDPHDFPITGDTMRVLFALHGEEPAHEGAPLPYHGSHRGARSLLLLQAATPTPTPAPAPDPPDLVAWELRVPPISLGIGEDSLVWCKIFKLPNLRRKHHMVRYEPVREEAARRFMRRALVYECAAEGPLEAAELEAHARDAGQPCWTPAPPDAYAACSAVVAAWASPSQGFSLPPEAGYPLDGERGPRYFMLEAALARPAGAGAEAEAPVAGAGLLFLHTPALRAFDAGVLSLGVEPSWRHIIPPGQREVLSQGHCVAQCTRVGLREAAVSVAAVLLRTHLIGRKARLRLIRDGEELAPITVDNNLDYDFQEFRLLPRPVRLQPGDHLVTDCVYDSMSRSTITLGGLTPREEVCLAYALYYPRVEMAVCHSLPALPTVLRSLGIEELWQGSSPVMIKAPPELADMTLESRLVTYDWEKNFRAFQDTMRLGSFAPRCGRRHASLFPGLEGAEARYPNATRLDDEQQPCAGGGLKKPRRRKKPGDAGGDAGGGGGGGGGGLGVQESSRLNGAQPGRRPLAAAPAAALAALLLLLLLLLPR